MGFDQALKMMRQDFRMTRTDWGDPERSITVKDDHFINDANQEYHPTVTDVLAMDWELVR